MGRKHDLFRTYFCLRSSNCYGSVPPVQHDPGRWRLFGAYRMTQYHGVLWQVRIFYIVGMCLNGNSRVVLATFWTGR